MQLYKSGSPMDRIALNIMEPLPETSIGNKYILVIGDYFTKWTEAFALPNQDTIAVANVLVEEIICRFGVPRQIHSDKSTQFESEIFSRNLQITGYRKDQDNCLPPTE
ncbi:hypothetical protein ACJMK2_018702 [Sinanodonta woodiana]|uniref:Integrase catalytic domain-containing protein n=1 Tax=Sinanodonta woodiana TaxID=1069815 RepID=A0ABD3UHM4_SINWO